jgi:hypothetical protein
MLEAAVRLHPGHAGFTYVHGADDIIEIVAAIGDEQLAIQRATALIDFHQEKPGIECNPSTQVHLLVQDLRSWIQYFAYEP